MRFWGKIKEVKKGQELFELGMFDEAIKQFSIAISKRKNIETYCLLAEAYFNNGDLINTKKTLREIIALGPREKIIKKVCELSGMKKIVSNEYINAFPSFSPDGNKIVFCSIRRDTNGDGVVDQKDNFGIYIIDIDGKNERQIVNDDYQNTYPSFSPDGSKIVFLSRRRDTNGDGKIDLLDNPGIYMKDLNEGYEKCIVFDQYYNKFPSFSPEGNKILFVSWRGYNSGIYTIDINGRNEKQIVSDEYDNTFPSFSPSGQKIVYASWRRDTNGDGKIDLRDNSGIYIIDSDGENEQEIVSDRYSNSFPVFSPDSTKIVYLSRRRDTNKDGKIDSLDNSGIYVCDIKGRNEKCIVSDKSYNKFPSFSPDGKKILFLSSDKSHQPAPSGGFFSWKGVYIVDVNGRNKRQIVSEKYYGNANPVFSPTQQKILYLAWREGTKRGIYLANVDTFPSLQELESLIENNL
jgi:TolB protein